MNPNMLKNWVQQVIYFCHLFSNWSCLRISNIDSFDGSTAMCSWWWNHFFIFLLFRITPTHDYNKSTIATELNSPYIKNNRHHPYRPIKIIFIVCPIQNINELHIVLSWGSKETHLKSFKSGKFSRWYHFYFLYQLLVT